MSFNVSSVLKDMLNTSATSFGNDWGQVKDLAAVEFRAILNRVKDIAKSVLSSTNAISISMAKHLIKAQKDLAVQAIIGFTTMTIVAVQKAINAALGVVKGAVNTAIGVTLL